MIRTHTFACHLPRADADALNRESGRIYTQTLVWHYRTYRHTGHWLSVFAAQKLGDSLSGTTLTAHSRDAAQEAFYKAYGREHALGQYPRPAPGAAVVDEVAAMRARKQQRK